MLCRLLRCPCAPERLDGFARRWLARLGDAKVLALAKLDLAATALRALLSPRAMNALTLSSVRRLTERCRGPLQSRDVKASTRQRPAGVAFLIVSIVDFTRDSSGIGVVFLVFAAVFLGLGLSGKTRQRRSSPQGD